MSRILLLCLHMFVSICACNGFAPFGPPYPITAAWFQDKFSKTEWNQTLAKFKDIGGDTVLLRAPAIRLRSEEDLEQDPEFQWCGDFNSRGMRTMNCTDSSKHDLMPYNITIGHFATFQYEEDYEENAVMQCPQYDKKIVTSRVYYRLVLPLKPGLQTRTRCDLNNTSVIVLFTTYAGVDPHYLLAEVAQEYNMSVFFGLPRPVTTYDQGYPEIESLLIPPYLEFMSRITIDHKIRYSSSQSAFQSLYSVVLGYYIDDHLTLADIHFFENYLIKSYYKPLVEMIKSVSKILAVGTSVQMNRFERNSTIDDNVEGFKALVTAGVSVVSVAEGHGMDDGGYFWETEATVPIATVDKDLDASLHLKYPAMRTNITFDEVFWTSVQKMFEAIGETRDALAKAGNHTELWLSVQTFQYLRNDLCLPVDRAGSGMSEMLSRVTKSRIDWALTAASWNVQKVASLAWDPCFICKTAKHASPLVNQIKQDMNRPIIAKCFFHSRFNRSVVVIGYNLEAETQGFTVNWPGADDKRRISNVHGYYFELDWGEQHQRVPSLEYTQLYDPYDIAQLRAYGWVKVSVGGGYHACSFKYDFRDPYSSPYYE